MAKKKRQEQAPGSLPSPELVKQFLQMTDQQRLALFVEKINGKTSPYDELLDIWWWKRY